MLVLCDFDGTITEQDVTNLIWDRYIWPDWRERLLPPYRAGKATTLDLMSQGYKPITATADELIAAIGEHVRIRAGFETLNAFCAAKSWPLHVVSCGLDWYLRAFLPPGVAFSCYAARHNGCWEVSLPEGITLAAGQDFKVHVLEKLLRQHPGRDAVFIGDGRNDFPIARACGRAFAVKGSTLAKMCREHGVGCVEFESFEEVVGQLKIS